MDILQKNRRDITTLLDIMRKLRDPNGGCPWDLEQDFKSIAPYTIEEAYEIDDAIRRDDMEDLRDELGDLLIQVAFHSQMADEQDLFSFPDVVQSICDKMIRRHPHVFAGEKIETADDQIASWERIKAEERKLKAHKKQEQNSILDNVAPNLPALMRAEKLQKRAAKVGFDWPVTKQVLDKIAEESAELVEAQEKEEPQERLLEEFGDLLFVVTNLGRHLNVDPELALRNANEKFERRFKYIEQQLKNENISMESASLETMDTLWNEAKDIEKKAAQ